MSTTTEKQFYDYFERRYTSRRSGPIDRATRYNRLIVLGNLLANGMEDHHPIAHLYAMMLARTYCQSDPELMKRYGEEVATFVHAGPLRDEEEEADAPPPRRRSRRLE